MAYALQILVPWISPKSPRPPLPLQSLEVKKMSILNCSEHDSG